MKNISKSILSIFIIALSLTSCSSDSKETNKPQAPPTPGSVKDVYVCGYEKKAPSGNLVATYWKNGIPVYLTDGSRNARLFDIEVVENDVYACGFEYNPSISSITPKYWKNGFPIDLSTKIGIANCIAVSDNNIYIGGDVSGKPVYWLNDAADRKDLSTNFGTVKDIKFIETASGTTVYSVGKDDNKAVYWKNSDVKVLLSTSGSANSLQIVNTDLYITGQNIDVLGYWKNTTFTPGVGFYGINVVNNDVYTCSANGTGNATYWKNTTPNVINTNISSVANDIVVANGNVYTCGALSSKAIYWINNTAFPLSAVNSESYRIFLTYYF